MWKKKNRTIISDFNLKTIADMVKSIRYGSVTIIVQDGKIIQIDKTEKIRIN